MNRKLLFIGLLACLFIVACGEETTSESTSVDPTPAQPETPPVEYLYTVVDHLRLRDAPGLDANLITLIRENSRLIDLKEKSDFITKVTMRGQDMMQPWIKVQTEEGQTGWVYRGGVSRTAMAKTDPNLFALENRLDSLFEKEIRQEIVIYKRGYELASNVPEVANIFRKGAILRDTINVLLEEISLKYENPSDQLGDFYWLEEAMPGYILQVAAEGTLFYFFQDYRQWLEKATTTEGAVDDDFFDLGIAINPLDSVEYFFPIWFMQTWDYGGYSELGKGVHLTMLKQMDQVLQKSKEFEPEVIVYKESLLDDIVNQHNPYWYDQASIIEEIDAIIDSGLSILTKNDKIALKTRRKQFENPEANGIELNQRTGE